LRDILIDREALTAIVAHARRDAPRECAGLLIGRPDQILEAVPATNRAQDPTRHYEIEPAEYFAQISRCRRISSRQSDTFAVVGSYHSHPRGGPEPSETDLAMAFPEFIFLIVGLGGGAGGMEIRAHELTGQMFTPLTLTVIDGPG